MGPKSWEEGAASRKHKKNRGPPSKARSFLQRIFQNLLSALEELQGARNPALLSIRSSWTVASQQMVSPITGLSESFKSPPFCRPGGVHRQPAFIRRHIV